MANKLLSRVAVLGLLLRITALGLALSLLPSSVNAAQPFDIQAFQEAQAASKSILIDVTAPWCPTCRQQKTIIKDVEKKAPSLVVFEVDFDSAKDVLRRFRVQRQSTLIVFKGRNEIARSVGDTNPIRIWDMIEKGL